MDFCGKFRKLPVSKKLPLSILENVVTSNKPRTFFPHWRKLCKKFQGFVCYFEYIPLSWFLANIEFLFVPCSKLILSQFFWVLDRIFSIFSLLIWQHNCGACGQELQRKRTFLHPQWNWWTINKWHLKLHISCFSFFSCYRYVLYADHSSELIQTITEPLRNKRVFTEHHILNGAIFVVTYWYSLL